MRLSQTAVLFIFFISACAPTQTPVPPTQSPQPSATVVLPTPTSQPTATQPPPTPTPESEDDDILTRAQKERIDQAARTLISPTQEDATAVAERLNYVQYASPSNMCGPLAFSILRDAGLLSGYTDLHDFWLLRPDTNADVIDKTFPPDRFEHFRFTTPIDQFNFKSFPLMVGDVLYLYAGKNGTFEHILTVTRVDEDGRAYSVTNLNHEPGEGYYTIEEVTLYDPNQPGVGIFYEWTNRKNLMIGLTGFGGFDVWRFSAQVDDHTSDELALADKLDTVFEQAGGDWFALILDPVTGRRVYERYSADRVHVASVIKVPVALLFFAMLEKDGVPPAELTGYLDRHGIDRTFNQLLHAMLVESEEDATKTLWDVVRQSDMNIETILEEWGVSRTDIPNRVAPLDDIVTLLAGLYRGDFVSPEARQIILGLMAEYTPNDDTRLGVLAPLLPEGGILYNKRGTLTDERLIVGDAGIVVWTSENGTQAYVIALFGYPGKTPTTDVRLATGIEQAALAFWEFAR